MCQHERKKGLRVPSKTWRCCGTSAQVQKFETGLRAQQVTMSSAAAAAASDPVDILDKTTLTILIDTSL